MFFQLPLALLTLSPLISLVSAIPTSSTKDTYFEQFRGLSHNQRDHSGRKGDPADKYFHESTFHPHYDGRFAHRPLPDDERIPHLTALVQTYLSTMHDIGAETWIMHGSLLGWWWNRKIMPWDTDIDVQVNERSIRFLADYHNMTVHSFKLPGEKTDRKYLIEINPNWENASTDDKHNMIDARWIDTDTGLFIDITTLRRNKLAAKSGLEGQLMCKDGHHYLDRQIFPLRDGIFEGMPVKIPFAYSELLEEEYGPYALTNRDFENHHFEETLMEWVPTNKPLPIPEYSSSRPSIQEYSNRKDAFIHETKAGSVFDYAA